MGALALIASGGVLLDASSSSARPFGYQSLNPIQQRHVSGLLATELAPTDSARAARQVSPLVVSSTYPQRPGTNSCETRLGSNVRVNVGCLNQSDSDLQGRAQAQNETYAAVDPHNSQYVLASYNDYRRGDGTCGTSFSLDGGKTFADSTVPDSFVRGTAFGGAARQYFQAGGDTSVGFDTKGNAYLSCQLFNRGSAVSANPDQSSAFYVFRSTGTHGASWNFPGRPVAEQNDTAGRGDALLDKQLLAVDNTVGSPYQDRVYVTYTNFASDGTGYIYEAYSADYGETFSTPVLVSRDTPACTQTFGLPTPKGRCNENQGSQPFVGRDGALYVTFANFNNATSAGGKDNHNQMLLARSSNGGRSFSTPVKVGDYYELPDCSTYQGGQDPGRACVPEKGASQDSYFRASNYPIGAVDPTNPNRVVVTYGSYINRDSNERRGCMPTGLASDGGNTYTGVKQGGCNNDILVSTSTNGGRSFSGTTVDPRYLPTINDSAAQGRTDQFWQSAAFTSTGTLVVSDLDRAYGNDERTGYSDVSVSTSTDRVSFTHKRATSSSMPPPTEFSGTFYGDYTGLAVSDTTAHPVWPDTRTVDEFICSGGAPTICAGSAPNAPVANDQDIFTNGLAIPASS